MIAVEPFRIEHIEEMRVHPSQRKGVDLYATAEYRRALSESLSHTLRIDGSVAFCGGVLDLYEDRRIGHIWTLLAEWAPRHMRIVNGVAKRLMQVSDKQVLVATTEVGIAGPCRWMRLLGFQFDHVEENFGHTGEAHAIYVRVL